MHAHATVHTRNPGLPLDLERVAAVQVNRSAVERRAATLPTRRTVKKEWQAAWLLRAITCIDLTTLAGDDTPGNVRRLCAKARQPVPRRHSGGARRRARSASTPARSASTTTSCRSRSRRSPGRHIPVAAVSTGFPAGQNPFPQKIAEIEASVAAGAQEIDIVISRAHVLTGDWQALYDEVRAFREACGDAHMKTILATGELGTLRNVARASRVCMMAGADFIKTSTGKETVNATLPVSLVMVRAIREYAEAHRLPRRLQARRRHPHRQAVARLAGLDERGAGRRLAARRTSSASARAACSTDIERQLEYFVTGRYSAAYHQPMA